jgi:putative transposase
MSAHDFLSAPRRKRVRHFDLPGDAHFLTFSCFHRLPLLGRDRTRKWFIESLATARKRHAFDLWAWVIMPEHVHLLIHPRAAVYDIAAILSSIKRPVGEKAIAYLKSRKSPFLEHLTVSMRTRVCHRFWQAGPGQDHNIYDPATAHRVIEYIHNNPQRRGLVKYAEDWGWSSAGDWSGSSDAPIRVDRTVPSVVEVYVP